MRQFFVCAVAACLAGSLMAQDVITAKAGLIHYIEGDLTLDGAMLSTRPGKFAEMKKNAVLKTMEGRAEVLLAPGSSVRLSENSSVQMLNTSLEDTRFAVKTGAAIVEVGELDKFMSIVVVAGDTEVSLRKKGVYSFSAEPGALKVFDGEASVASGGKSVIVGRGRVAELSGDILVAKFDAKNGDELYRWAKRRSYYMSMANLSAANSVQTQGNTWRQSGWMYNPYFGMYTFIPMNGMYMSPWGYSYFSPRRAYEYISVANNPNYYGGGYNAASGYSAFQGTGRMGTSYDSGLGYNTAPMRSSGGYSGGGGTVSAPAASAGGGGGVRGDGGGGAVGGGGGGGTRGGGGGGGRAQ